MQPYMSNDSERFYRARARSQPPIFVRHENAERYHYYEPNYSRVENLRVEDERHYNSDPEILSSSDDDDFDNFSGYEPDWEAYEEQQPNYASRMRRAVSTPNLRVEVDNIIRDRHYSRDRSPAIAESPYFETVRENLSYRTPAARNIRPGREEFSHEYELYDELPSIRLPRSRSRGHLFREPSYEIPFVGRHSHNEGRLEGESKAQVTSRMYESGTYVQHWQEPVKFKPQDELLKPVEWQAKLEILEAQVLDHSSFRDFPQHMQALKPTRFFIHIADARRVIYKVISNLKRMKKSNYCSETFNILILEKQRPNVARLVGISLNSITIFSDQVTNLLFIEGDLSFQQARDFLRSCYDFLLAIGLDIPAFQDSYGYYSDGNICYSYVRSREGILSAIMYATRVIGYLLDIATVSFCGAHLEPFDEVYFDRVSSTNHYRLPCDAHGAAIDLQLRTFQCLEGFLQGRSAWVFSSTEAGYTDFVSNEPLYLSTKPDEFANLWGPMWKSTSPVDPRSTLRYIVSPGFIIPWRRTSGQPALLPDEVNCHWTMDSYDINSIFSQTVHGKIERLLIGAHSKLLWNSSCRPNKQDFYSTMSRKMALRNLEFNHGSWATGPINVSAALSTPAFSPLSLTATVGTTFTKKPQKSLRDHLCKTIAADPRSVVHYLNEHYGVEISACTGHARRIQFSKVLSSQTMQEYLYRRVQWSSSDKDRYFRALQEDDSNSAAYHLYMHGSEDQKRDYDTALKLSITALAETKVKGGRLQALWALNGRAYIVSFRVSDHEWAGLLTDTLTTCSVIIVNQTCLECSTTTTRHYPDVPIGKPTVFQTKLVINPEARLPAGLNILTTSTKCLSEKQISNRLRKGDTFDIKDHGRVRVLRTPVNASGKPVGVFVELIKTFIPARRQGVKNFFLKVRGKDQIDSFHREYKDDMRDRRENCFFVFVVSDPRQAGPWLLG